MSKDINKLGDNGDLNPKTPKNLGEDFEIWMKGSEEQKDFLETKTHLDTQSELADLRESFGKKSPEKGYVFTDTTRSHLTLGNNSGASFETIQTRQKGDANKNIFQGVAESIYVPFRALKDTFIDTTRIAFSPVEETKRTIAYLEKESSAKII